MIQDWGHTPLNMLILPTGSGRRRGPKSPGPLHRGQCCEGGETVEGRDDIVIGLGQANGIVSVEY